MNSTSLAAPAKGTMRVCRAAEQRGENAAERQELEGWRDDFSVNQQPLKDARVQREDYEHVGRVRSAIVRAA